jgi:hypothetical protein
MAELTQRSSGPWTRTAQLDAAAYRKDFLQLLTSLDLKPGQAIALVEAGTGRPFDTCSPMDLVPLLQQLLEVLHSQRTPVEAGQPWAV